MNMLLLLHKLTVSRLQILQLDPWRQQKSMLTSAIAIQSNLTLPQNCFLVHACEVMKACHIIILSFKMSHNRNFV